MTTVTALPSVAIIPKDLSQLPANVLATIVKHIRDHQDQVNLMLVCKGWSRHIAESAYRAPPLQGADSFERLMGLLNTPLPVHPYPQMIRELDISGLAADNLYMGDLNSALTMCRNIEIFRLENCYHISNMLVRSIADYCRKIKQVDLPGCPVTDTFIPHLTKSCKNLESIDLSFSNVSIGSLYSIITNCENLLHVDMTECQPLDKDAKPIDWSSKGYSRPLRLLNLRNTRVTDTMLKFVVAHCNGLENVILDSCSDITDDSLMKLAQKNTKLKRLDCSFSDGITDKTLQALAIRAAASNGGALEQLYLSACEFITAPAVQQLAQKSLKLQILVLDGCDRILGTFIQDCATRKDDLECTLEGDDIRKMTAFNASSLATPPISPERKKDDSEFKVAVEYVPKHVELNGAQNILGLSNGRCSPIEEHPEEMPTKAHLLRRKSSRAAMDADDDPHGYAARMERQERIREKRKSRSERGPPEPPSTSVSPTSTGSTAVVSPKSDYQKEDKTAPYVPRHVRRPSNQDPQIQSQTQYQTGVWADQLPGTTGAWGVTPPAPPVNSRSYSADPWAQPVQPIPQAQFTSPPRTSTFAQGVSPNSPPVNSPPVNSPPVNSSGAIPLVSGRRKSTLRDNNPPTDIVTPVSTEGSTLLASGRAARNSISAASVSHPPVTEAPPSDAVEATLLIASGRRSRKASAAASTAEVANAATAAATVQNGASDWKATSTAQQQSQGPWGTNPSAWNNPSQQTSPSSIKNNGPQGSQFIDPWGRPGPHQQHQPSSDPWSNAPGQSSKQVTPPGSGWAAVPVQQPGLQQPTAIRTAVGAGWQTQQQQQHAWNANSSSVAPVGQPFGGSPPEGVAKPGVYFDRKNAKSTSGQLQTRKWNEEPEQGGFVFSGARRGRMLLKLKIETKNGGHQTLAVHELDDPQQLATEFCGYWDMIAFRDPLVRLISVRKTNAMRLRQPQN